MPSGHGRNDYTLERMLERRNRNNIRKVLERNGRRLTAKEIDIVNLCTRHPDQRYMLFTYYCDGNCTRLNPYVVPHISMVEHYLLHQRRNLKLQQNVGAASDCDRSASTSTSFVAPLLLQLNVEVNAANDCIDRRSHSCRPSTSLLTLPCYFLTDRPQPSSTSTPENNIKSSSDKGNSEKDSFDYKGNDGNGSSGKGNSAKSSRKNSKKKNRKKGGTKARLSKTQTRSDNLSNESVFSSSSHAGDECDQRVKSDTEGILRCISNKMSDQCYANVSCSRSIRSDDEGENMKLALSMHAGDVIIHEDSSAFEKADEGQFSSNSCMNNEFIPVVFGKRRRYGKRYCQESNQPSRSVAFNRCSDDQYSTWQEKPSKIAIRDKSTSHKSRSSRPETSITLQSLLKVDTSNKQGGNLSRHSGEYVFRKDDFPSLPSPDNEVRSMSTERKDLKNPHAPLSREIPEKCKECESEVGVDIKFRIPFLEVKIGEVEESGSGCGSSSGAYFSPDSCKSCEMNQSSSQDSSGTDSPRSSKSCDPNPNPNPNEGHKHNVRQSGENQVDLNDNSPSVSDTDAFKSGSGSGSGSGSVTCSSSAASTTPVSVSPSNSSNAAGFNSAPTIFHRDLDKILSAVRAAHKVYQRVEELAQAQATGPLADYELLCRSAAPLVGFLPGQIINMPLQNIWQWYEEPSCYALEVKGCQDHQQLLNFNAHFVPSLSALQLFLRHQHMPKLPCVDDDILSVNAGPAELLFEYFEHDQPYFRQSLFGKVKELIDGVAQGRSYVNGDGRNLEELVIGDLHPASWYCVAWYPAYRVPEGRSSFKAAFLTYHSLVHFVPKGNIMSSCPVVGLMSYNTQGESWYHERFQAGGDIMEERLESLNLTALLMARAQVIKDHHQLSMNHHPDFEFFASRHYPN